MGCYSPYLILEKFLNLFPILYKRVSYTKTCSRGEGLGDGRGGYRGPAGEGSGGERGVRW